MCNCVPNRYVWLHTVVFPTGRKSIPAADPSRSVPPPLPEQMYQHLDKVFPVLLTKLSDPADEVVVLNIQVLAEICSANPAG